VAKQPELSIEKGPVSIEFEHDYDSLFEHFVHWIFEQRIYKPGYTIIEGDLDELVNMLDLALFLEAPAFQNAIISELLEQCRRLETLPDISIMAATWNDCRGNSKTVRIARLMTDMAVFCQSKKEFAEFMLKAMDTYTPDWISDLAAASRDWERFRDYGPVLKAEVYFAKI
jgi:hypothetical protein